MKLDLVLEFYGIALRKSFLEENSQGFDMFLIFQLKVMLFCVSYRGESYL